MTTQRGYLTGAHPLLVDGDDLLVLMVDLGGLGDRAHAQADDRLVHSVPGADLPAIVQGSGHAIHPEGVTWDPTRNAFLIGSIRYGTVSVVGADGIPHTLVDDPYLIATGGVRVDVARDGTVSSRRST